MDSDQQLKQGILISSKLCSYCNTSPDIKLESVKCMNCGDLYHCPCLLSPLGLEYVKDISENPCLFWCCLDCLSLKNDSDRMMAPNSGNEFLRKSDLNDLMTFVGNAVTQLKSDIAKHVDAKIENVLSESASPAEIIPNADSGTVTVEKLKVRSFADVTKSTPELQCNTENDATLIKDASDVHPKLDISNNVILLKPNEGKQNTPSDETMKLINSSVQGLDVDYCRPRKSGIIAIKVTDENNKLEVINRLNNNSNLSTNYKVKLPQEKQLPKVTITGINKLLFDDCVQDDSEGMRAKLVQDILARNNSVKRVLENAGTDKEEFIEVVFLKKITHKDGNCTYTAALKVTSKVRHAIHMLGDKLFIFLNRCKVFDRFYVTQCYHCQKIGHTFENCKEKHSKPLCRFCSKSHNSHSCDVRDNADAHCCVNCLSSDNNDHKINAASHTASSFKCPYFQRCIQHVKQNTVDWLPKNCH